LVEISALVEVFALYGHSLVVRVFAMLSAAFLAPTMQLRTLATTAANQPLIHLHLFLMK